MANNVQSNKTIYVKMKLWWLQLRRLNGVQVLRGSLSRTVHSSNKYDNNQLLSKSFQPQFTKLWMKTFIYECRFKRQFDPESTKNV